MDPSLRRITSRSAGFSLVELMVGLVIGMIAIIIMMQVFAVSEGYKRTSTGGGDAQNNGAIALYAMQREMRQGGHGVNAWQVIGCDMQLRAGIALDQVSPLTINRADIPAGDANTDTLMVVQSNTNGAPEGDKVEAQPAQNTYAVATPSSFAVGDLVVVTAQDRDNATACSLNVEAVTAVAAPNVSVGTGVLGMAGGILFNLGQAPSALVYAVRGGNLTICDFGVDDCGAAGNVNNAAVWVPIAANVVSLRAQYGRDAVPAAMDGIVDAWDQTTPTTGCGWMRVSAARLALVTRNAQYDKEVVTANAPTWTGTAANAINLSGDADWQHYRYRVFETVMPMRNMAWLGVQAGC